MMRTVTITCLVLLLGACSSLADSFTLADGSSHDGNISLVNGQIEIGAECRIDGEVSNVNGTIEVGRATRLLDISNVNGRISLAEAVEVEGDVSGVNGRIELASGARVSGDVETVNGRVSAGEEVVIGGTIGSVNGSIEMHAARAGRLVTTNSQVRLEAGTVIEGELRVRKSQGVNFNAGSPPKIVIGRDVRIEGPLVFEREVALYVHETASVGEITGAEAVVYSGDSP